MVGPAGIITGLVVGVRPVLGIGLLARLTLLGLLRRLAPAGWRRVPVTLLLRGRRPTRRAPTGRSTVVRLTLLALTTGLVPPGMLTGGLTSGMRAVSVGPRRLLGVGR